jgi:glucan phosphoethanolaminetransferase (alkaline phosphatase superfamily)
LFLFHVSSIKSSLFGREFPNNSFVTFLTTLSDYVVHTPIQQAGSNKRPPVSIPSAVEKPTNNIILVFDESIRADHLSLNGYERKTTPFLESLLKRGLLLNWGTAASASTSSHPSYDAFIIGAQPDELEQSDQQALNASMPSIFQYAKAMGYRTIMFDGQMMDFWGGVKDDLNYVDEFDSLAVIDRPDRKEDYQMLDTTTTEESKRVIGMKQWQIDARIAEMVSAIFTSSSGNFIFIYKRGCHFPYEKNFPPEEAVWQPVYHFHDQYEIPPTDKINAVVNSYDDSLKYNLDEFFRKLAPDYANLANNTVIVYTGDHGESFFQNGRAGHGGDTVGEAEVPLFMLGVKDKKVDTTFKASHHNLFATLLDLMNYPEELRGVNYSISLFQATSADSRPRFFNPGPGKKVPFDQ